MMNILVTSEDAARLAQIARLAGDCGLYRITRAAGKPSQLEGRAEGLDAFDALLVDAGALQAAELAVIERLCREHPGLTCILITADASPQTLIEAMRAGVRDVLGWPLERQTLAEALERAAAQRPARNAGDTHDTQFLSFISCKGGTGTSLIAGNVAWEIAQMRDKRVLLVDLNQQFGDAAFLVTDETPPSTLPQMCAQVERMDGAFFDASVLRLSENFHVLAGAGDPVRSAEIREDGLEWILGVAAPRYDFVILDLGVSINRLSMIALDLSEQIHLVLQANMPHVRAARRLQEILVSLGYPVDRMRLILNRYARSGERARAALEEVLGLRAWQTIPDDESVVTEAINQGLPVSKLARSSNVARSLQRYANQIVEAARPGNQASGRGEPLFARLLGRGASPRAATSLPPKATPKLRTM